jgi:hypothetical protein
MGFGRPRHGRLWQLESACKVACTFGDLGDCVWLRILGKASTGSDSCVSVEPPHGQAERQLGSPVGERDDGKGEQKKEKPGEQQQPSGSRATPQSQPAPREAEPGLGKPKT